MVDKFTFVILKLIKILFVFVELIQQMAFLIYLFYFCYKQNDFTKLKEQVEKYPQESNLLCVTDDSNNTLLHLLCSVNNFVTFEIFKILVSKGLNIHAKNNCNETPFFIACTSGNVPIANFLFEQGVNPTEKQGMYKQTPFIEACRHARPNIVKFLIPFVSTEELNTARTLNNEIQEIIQQTISKRVGSKTKSARSQ